METVNCNEIQVLVDKSVNEPLSTDEKAKIIQHVEHCDFCAEYENRTNLFSDLLFKKITESENKQRINSYQEAILQNSKSVQARLASIPEMNPSPILEIETSGRVSYQNPAFAKYFPSIVDINEECDLFKNFKLRFKDLVEGRITTYSEEIMQAGVYFSKRANYIPELKVVRIFYLDITEQKEYQKIITQKNKEITDSIQYAKRIQDSILPSDNYFKSKFPESFILFKPKDIVAGDFYWLVETNDYVFVAAADCTGHGVPGALVSIVCSNALNRSVNEFGIRDTGKILDKTRELVFETFTKNDKAVNDGMDISLVGFNKKENKITWSGANNSLWYFSNGLFNEIPANKQSVGKTDCPNPFKTHTLQLNTGDILYLYTDGYADQFGGEKEKKFKYKQLQELLLTTHSKTPEEQKIILDTEINKWKGNCEQTDDILVIGIKV
ncbi:MAG: SpoIIE family protein phosphatase [Bacteroidota bacterium]|nr:SpoIIE family protein phosphatase [Bacteroidota bacterium]